MKKLTAGIFAGILTVVMAAPANAQIASKSYVDHGDNLKVNIDQTTAKAKNAMIVNDEGKVAPALIKDENIADAAAIASKKLAEGLVTQGAGVSVVRDATSGVYTVAASGIKDAQVADDAAIASKKLAEGLVTQGAGVSVVRDATSGVYTVSSNLDLDALPEGIVVGDDTTATVEENDGVYTVAVKDGGIANAQISDTAEIASKKLAEGLVTQGAGVSVVRDATSGVYTVAASGIKDAQVADDAAIASKKLAEGLVAKGTGVSVERDATSGVYTISADTTTLLPKTTGAAGHYVLTADIAENGVVNYQWEGIVRDTENDADSHGGADTETPNPAQGA